MEALLTYVQRQWKHFRIKEDGRDLREHLIHSLHFPDEMKMRQMENLVQSHTQLTSKSVLFPKKILHGGKWSIILVGWRTSQTTFIKHLLCTRHLTRCYQRYKD